MADVLAKPLLAPQPETVGVIVLAHGSLAHHGHHGGHGKQPPANAETWNENVRTAVNEADLKYPVELVFGMGMESIKPYQAAVDRLATKKVSRIVVVPLLISSYSEVYHQYQYLFGLQTRPALPEWKMPKLKVTVPVKFAKALDDDPVVPEILADRLAQGNGKAGHVDTAVVLVAHGPNDGVANERWIKSMGTIAEQLKRQSGVAEIRVFTLRDDAEASVQAKATQEIRSAVEQLGRLRKVRVLPLLMSEGGIERGITRRLKGLTYEFIPKGLLPHPKVSQWIRSRVDQLAPVR